jgi:hypothetical protein
MPRTAQDLGGSSFVTFDVTSRAAPPIRRVVVHFEPTLGGLSPSMLPPTTPSCHSENLDGSVT